MCARATVAPDSTTNKMDHQHEGVSRLRHICFRTTWPAPRRLSRALIVALLRTPPRLASPSAIAPPQKIVIRKIVMFKTILVSGKTDPLIQSFHTQPRVPARAPARGAPHVLFPDTRSARFPEPVAFSAVSNAHYSDVCSMLRPQKSIQKLHIKFAYEIYILRRFFIVLRPKPHGSTHTVPHDHGGKGCIECGPKFV